MKFFKESTAYLLGNDIANIYKTRKLSIRNVISIMHFLLQFGVLFYILLFPFGQALREITSIVAITGTLGIYILDYQRLNIKKIPIKYILLIFFSYLIFKAFCSIDIDRSLDALQNISYDSFLLILAGVEFTRRKADYKLAILACTITLTILGYDALYQYTTGYDIFKNYPMRGSCTTACMRLPHLGTLAGALLPLTFAYPLIITKCNKIKRYLLWFIFSLLPILFFILTSERRSAWLGLILALCFYLIFVYRHKAFWTLATLFVISIPTNIFEILLKQLWNDPRWIVWNYGFDIFLKKPWLGHGLHSFKSALKQYGVGEKLNNELFIACGTKFSSIFDSPHNIYLGFLIDGGIIGLMLFLLFSFSCLLLILRSSKYTKTDDRLFSNLLLCGAICYVSYLGAAITGLDFYKTWMLGPPILILGITLGATLLTKEKPSKPLHCKPHL